MSTPTIFNFQSHDVRVVMKGDEPWWVARDVCDVLSISKYRDAVAGLDDDEKGGPVKVDTLGGPQEMAVVNESGLYTLIFRSNKPEAKVFRKWVTSEVLPQIRKTGSYNFDQGSINQSVSKPVRDELLPLLDMAHALGLEGHQAQRQAARATENLTGHNPLKMLGIDKRESDRRKYYTPTELCGLLQNRGNVSIEDLTIVTGVGGKSWSAAKMNAVLREMDLQENRRIEKGKNQWVATEDGEKYSTLIDSGDHGGKARQHLHWYEDVIPLVEDFIASFTRSFDN